MAILTGFPPSNTISPSVRITEQDQSFIAAEQTFHRAGLVGFASKGPVNIPTLIRTSRQLTTVFGNPHPDVGDPYLIYAAKQYLLVANELFIVRVADEDAVSDERAAVAEVQIPAAGSAIVVQSDTAHLYSFATDSFFRWRLNGVLASKTLVVLSDANRLSPDTGMAYTCDDLAATLNSQVTSAVDGIVFSCSSSNKININTTFAFGPDSSFELVSVQDAIYGGAVLDGNVTGLGTGMTQASETGSLDRYPNDGYQTAGNYDFTGLTDLNLQIVIDGSDNVLIDNVIQTLDLADLEGQSNTIAEVVIELNSQITDLTVPGGWEAVATGNNLTINTLHHGQDARLLIKSASTAETLFGFAGLTVAGTSPSGVTTDAAVTTYGIITGGVNVTSLNTFKITAESAGIDGNGTQVVIANDIRENVFTINVFNNGIQVENWGNLVKDQTSRFYVETFLALVSDYVRAVDNTATAAPPLDGTYTLIGGVDGIPADPDDQDSLLIGSPLDFSGMYALSEPEQIDIDLIAVPGHPSTNVILGLLDVVENFRKDALAIIDPPFGLTVNEIIQWQNGSHPLNTTRFDSDFGALYWPWLKIRDSFNQVDVFVPPSGSVMAVIARNDQIAEPWFAPAGTTRGLVPNVLDVFSRPTLEERDEMYGNRNAVNPIIQFSDLEGFVVFGDKTLQRNTTELDRVNVRRLMFVIEKTAQADSRNLLFDPHDEEIRARLVDLSTRI